jgi:hypothetical protein
LKKGFGPHDKEPLPLDDLNVKEDLTIVEHPIRILETMTRVTRNSVIKMCKVQWSNHAEDEATWEREDELSRVSKSFSQSVRISRTKFLLRGVGFVIP